MDKLKTAFRYTFKFNLPVYWKANSKCCAGKQLLLILYITKSVDTHRDENAIFRVKAYTSYKTIML